MLGQGTQSLPLARVEGADERQLVSVAKVVRQEGNACNHAFDVLPDVGVADIKDEVSVKPVSCGKLRPFRLADRHWNEKVVDGAVNDRKALGRNFQMIDRLASCRFRYRQDSSRAGQGLDLAKIPVALRVVVEVGLLSKERDQVVEGDRCVQSRFECADRRRVVLDVAFKETAQEDDVGPQIGDADLSNPLGCARPDLIAWDDLSRAGRKGDRDNLVVGNPVAAQVIDSLPGNRHSIAQPKPDLPTFGVAQDCFCQRLGIAADATKGTGPLDRLQVKEELHGRPRGDRS